MTMRCFLDGKFMSLAEAKISPMDRGFLFGDGVYEVVPVYARKLFCWRRHMQRLSRNLAELRILFDAESLFAPADDLVQSAESSDSSLYIQITRGISMTRRHAFPETPVAPTVFMFAAPRAPAPEDKRINGVACRTMEEFRWKRADIKSVSLLGAVLAAQSAAESDCEETILIRDGLAGEAASCNIFAVSGGEMFTPPADNLILPGITRAVVIELAKKQGISVYERPLSQGEMAAADELWITSSAREILPVCILDGAPVGTGVPGAMYKAMHAAFRQFVEDDIGR